MAGHSHSANVKHRKGAVDAKRAKIFSKLSRAIISAARQGGPDVDSNLKLKYAVEKARAGNMPKDNIERAIKRAIGEKGGEGFEELVYEGYAPGGVALMVSCLTDNRNRTAPDIKYIFDRSAGNIGSPGSVSFMFKLRSIFVAERPEGPGGSEERLMELALEAGAEDVEVESELVTIVAPAADFLTVKQALESADLELVSAETGYMPQTTVPIGDKDEARKVLKLIETLEDHDDVQNVYANYEMPEEWIEELSS
jgi:YebC/PmpR family DNA-binding regulatory protein